MQDDKQRERKLLEEALTLSPEQRTEFLSRACAKDQRLRARVEDLLRAFAEVPAAMDPEKPTLDEEVQLTEGEGSVIGRYKLLQQIGEGGFGVVYMAEQTEPVLRRVALKIIKLGMDTKQVIARFEAERQALALMDHPNIAKVLDAGSTAAGRPYFVMELVKGIPITRYCDDQKLTTEERLRLFMDVCAAVQHAHQKGIIHRDIKPSNILVTLHDGVPVPKIIDFGIAKATQSRLTERTLFTRFEQFLGTPAYMSPEQAEMSGLDVDTRSDIYSLGVLLYELLTGRTPLDTGELQSAGHEEVRRRIREEETVKPSTRLHTLNAEEQTTVAKRRSTEAGRLNRLLRGDLDWIVLKALEKDRTRRYETATALREDVRRYLEHEAIAAVAPSTTYLLRRLVRRHRGAVTAVGAIALILMLATMVSLQQAWVASRAREAERGQRLAAQAERDRAREAEDQAEAERDRAEQARAEATAERDRQRLHAYASDIMTADLTLSAGNFSSGLRLLRRHIPTPEQTDLRGIEWRYLWEKTRGDDLFSLEHSAFVTWADVSPDGLWMATACMDHKTRVWDVKTRQLQLELESPVGDQPQSSLAFSPSGHWFAAQTLGGVRVWRTCDWTEQRLIPTTNAWVSFSGDGGTLVVLGADGLQAWCTSDWQRFVSPEDLSVKHDGVWAMVVSRDGGTVIVAYPFREPGEQGIKVWDLRSRTLLAGLVRAETEFPVSLAIAPDDSSLAAGCWAGAIRVWSLSDFEVTADFKAHEGLIFGLTYMPDGECLVSGGMDQRIAFWHAGTSEQVGYLRGHLGEIWSLRFSADGRTLVSAGKDRTARLWPPRPAEDRDWLLEIPKEWDFLGVTSEGDRAATFDRQRNVYQEWIIPGFQLARTASFPGAPTQLAGWPPIVRHGRVLFGSPDGHLEVRDFNTGALITSSKIGEGRIHLGVVSPDGRLLVVDDRMTSGQRRGMLWNLTTGQIETLLPDYSSHGDYSAFSPDGRWLVYPAREHRLVLWDLEGNRTASVLKGHHWHAYTAAFSHDGELLATSDWEGVALIRDFASLRLATPPLVGHLSGVYGLWFAPDNRTLQTFASGETKLWSVATGQELIHRRFQQGYLLGLSPSFSPDGTLFWEEAGRGRGVKFTRLRTLAEIDATERTHATTGRIAD